MAMTCQGGGGEGRGRQSGTRTNRLNFLSAAGCGCRCRCEDCWHLKPRSGFGGGLIALMTGYVFHVGGYLTLGQNYRGEGGFGEGGGCLGL